MVRLHESHVVQRRRADALAAISERSDGPAAQILAGVRSRTATVAGRGGVRVFGGHAVAGRRAGHHVAVERGGRAGDHARNARGERSAGGDHGGWPGAARAQRCRRARIHGRIRRYASHAAAGCAHGVARWFRAPAQRSPVPAGRGAHRAIREARWHGAARIRAMASGRHAFAARAQWRAARTLARAHASGLGRRSEWPAQLGAGVVQCCGANQSARDTSRRGRSAAVADLSGSRRAQ